VTAIASRQIRQVLNGRPIDRKVLALGREGICTHECGKSRTEGKKIYTQARQDTAADQLVRATVRLADLLNAITWS
jgi:hypothetical protein